MNTRTGFRSARRRSLVLPWLIGLAAACSVPRASPVEDAMFGGKTLRILVGFGAGGGYDLHARLIAGYLGRHLPGGPTVVVQTMTGAGGLIAANHLARQARPDGLTLGFFGLGVVLPQLLGRAGVQYDARQYAIIGAPTFEPVDVCIATRGSDIDLASWRRRASPVRMAITSSGSASHARTALLAAALALPIHLVTGYDGMAAMRLALDSGEVDAVCAGLGAYRTSFEPLGKYVVLFQAGENAASLQDVPSVAGLIRDQRERSLFDIYLALRTLDRFLLAPPETPPDVVDALRTAFDATMNDAEFRAAARTADLEIRPLSAHEIAGRIESVLTLPADARRDVVALLGQGSTR